MLGQYGSLLTVLVMLILLQPSVETTVGKYLLEGLFIAALLAGLRAVDIKRALFRFLVVLLLCSLGLSAMSIVSGSVGLFATAIAGRGLFLSLVAIAILYDLFKARSVTADTLAGAVCVYLLIATTWAYGYLLVEYINPESFSFTQAYGRMEIWLSKEFYPFFYFSLVTMTTVGYGDMSPVSPEARTLATLEALVGQIYLTILVARLVGMHLVYQQGKEE